MRGQTKQNKMIWLCATIMRLMGIAEHGIGSMSQWSENFSHLAEVSFSSSIDRVCTCRRRHQKQLSRGFGLWPLHALTPTASC